MSKRYLDIPCSRMTPNEKRLYALKDMTVRYKLDIAIDFVHTPCHSYNFNPTVLANI